MLVTKRSRISGKESSMELPISEGALAAWETGRISHVQDAFPGLTPDQREFLLTGITPEEWEETFGSGDDDE